MGKKAKKEKLQGTIDAAVKKTKQTSKQVAEQLRAAAVSQRAMEDARALGRKIGEEGKRLRKLAEKEGRRPREDEGPITSPGAMKVPPVAPEGFDVVEASMRREAVRQHIRPLLKGSRFEKAPVEEELVDGFESSGATQEERDAAFEKAHQAAVEDELEATKDAEFDESESPATPPNDLNQQNFDPIEPYHASESPCYELPKTAKPVKQIIWSATYEIPGAGGTEEVASNFQKWQEAQRLISKAGVVFNGSAIWELAGNDCKPKELLALEKQQAKLSEKIKKFHLRRGAKVQKLHEEIDALETQLFVDLFSEGDCSVTKMAKLISKHIERVKKIEQKAKSAWK